MKISTLFALATGLLVAALPSTQAAVGLMNLSATFTGTAPAVSPALQVRFEDGFGANVVRITMDATNLTGNEFVSNWFLNVNPLIDPATLSFSLVSAPGVPSFGVSNILKGANAYRADGDGFYDLEFDFPPPPGSFAAKFTSGEKVVVDAYRSSGLAFSDFFFLSAPAGPGNPGPFYAAAHVQGIGAGNDSGWIGTGSADITAIPEPASGAMLAASTVFAALWLRRRIRPATASLAG